MSLESIIKHILDDAAGQREKIIQAAKIEAEKIIQAAKIEAEKIYQEILDKEKSVYQRQKQKLIVQARLEQKKDVLEAKQGLIDTAFENLKSGLTKDKFKKQQISQDHVKELNEDMDFYLTRVRADYEVEIAKILFI